MGVRMEVLTAVNRCSVSGEDLVDGELWSNPHMSCDGVEGNRHGVHRPTLNIVEKGEIATTYSVGSMCYESPR